MGIAWELIHTKFLCFLNSPSQTLTEMAATKVLTPTTTMLGKAPSPPVMTLPGLTDCLYTETPAPTIQGRVMMALNKTASELSVKNFTIGSQDHGARLVKDGSVQDAKRKLEAGIMKEKREKRIETSRKPTIATPNIKRARNGDDEWDGLQDVQEGAPSPRTPVRAGRRLQTPKNSFLVHQTPEQRRRQLQRPINSQLDMSASPVRRNQHPMRDCKHGTARTGDQTGHV